MSTAVLERVSVFAGVSEAINVVAEQITRSIVAVRQGQGGGSGVIWRPEGIILTNHHVVPGDGAEVVTNDGRRLRARATAHDPLNDLAVLQVDATDLPAATIGDSRALRIGQPGGKGRTPARGRRTRPRRPARDRRGRALPAAGRRRTGRAGYPGNGPRRQRAPAQRSAGSAFGVGRGRALTQTLSFWERVWVRARLLSSGSVASNHPDH